jgi:hypothetical protein
MHANLVLANARIHTMNPAHPLVSAVALRDDRILAIGDDDDMRALLGRGGEWVDLEGRAVTPGLIDAHVHFSYYARGLQEVNLEGITALDAALAQIRARAATLPPGGWLQGRGWTTALFGGAFPSAADLDRVVGDVPVFLRDKSGHAAWVSTAAMRRAGITADSRPPAGGSIGFDAAGQPDGILYENGMDLVRRHVPNPSVDAIAAAMRVAQKNCWAAGLVGVHDFDGRDCFQALQQLHRAGELGLRLVKNIPARHLDEAIGVGLQSGFGDDWLRIGGVKIFADGALGPRTALMLAPYEGEPANLGIAVTDREEMKEIASVASAAGLSVTVHAIGDRANRDILDVYEAVRGEEAARGEAPGRLRHRIEHVQIIHPADQPRLAALDIIASMQPLHATSDMLVADRHWGARARHSYAWRAMLSSGATLVFGSDSPVEPIEPLKGIYAAVTRRRPDGSGGPAGWYPEQKLTMTETIHAFTTAAAVTSSQEATQGSVTPGKLADLTIFDRDIFTVAADELAETTISGTIIGGRWRHRTV